jgi:enoyl-CoA hydratase/carnithine racemase
MGDSVLYELDGHVATITYNRPEALNAINAELRADLNAAFARLRDEEDAWVGIVTGRGEAFCAGGAIRLPDKIVSTVDAIRFGETMRKVAAATERSVQTYCVAQFPVSKSAWLLHVPCTAYTWPLRV